MKHLLWIYSFDVTTVDTVTVGIYIKVGRDTDDGKISENISISGIIIAPGLWVTTRLKFLIYMLFPYGDIACNLPREVLSETQHWVSSLCKFPKQIGWRVKMNWAHTRSNEQRMMEK